MKTNYINQLQRNIMQDENFHCMPDNEHPKQEQSLLESMKEYFEKTPKKQVQKDWEEILKETEGINSPTINEFLEAQKQFGTQEQSILSIEQMAENSFKNHHIGQHDLANDVYIDGFIAGANDMLPIIKELGEALQILMKEYKALADSGDCGWWLAEEQDEYKQSQTTLNKYKNYL